MSTDYECNGDVETCRFCGAYPETDKLDLWIAFCQCNDNCFVGDTKWEACQKWNDYHENKEEPETERYDGIGHKKL